MIYTPTQPKRIEASQWDTLIHDIPAEFRESCRFLRDLVPGGVPYLYTPYEYSCRGDALLLRLKYDSSPASLRLWSFLFSEKDRLFLAREKGWKIFAVMKDLGQTAILGYAVPRSLTFYADELWWAPCFSEEPHLLDKASELGATAELCYVRAALGAMKTLDYFPRPDLCIAGVGACCDDFSAIMQLIEWQGLPIHWWEIPARFRESRQITESFQNTPHGNTRYQKSAVPFLKREYEGIIKALEKTAGVPIREDMLRHSVRLFNQVRGKINRLREMVYGASKVPLPGLEMLLAEFIGIHLCSDPVESHRVLDTLLEEVEHRLREGTSPHEGDPVRIYWVMPPTDASLVTAVEDMGGCVTGSDYLIGHSYLPLREDIHPLESIAENHMDDPMIGSSAVRARKIVEEARKFRAEGVLITGIFGASHCPFEERRIIEEVEKQLNIPVLSLDVPYSPKVPSQQVMNRLQGFMEMLRFKRREKIMYSCGSQSADNTSYTAVTPKEYFRDSMSREVDYVRKEKSMGRKIVGIYCEYTPREIILAAGAVPVCLCGTSHRTVSPAETVLPSNLCPLIKSSFGYILTNRCPFVVVSDMIVAETTCDGKKKMYEILAEKKRVEVLELTQKLNSDSAFQHWHDELQRFRRVLEEEFSVEITDERLLEAIRLMNEERAALREAIYLGAKKPSVVSGKELATLRFRVAGMPDHMRMIRKFIDEVKERENRGETIAPPNAPRVLLTGCPTGKGSEKVIEIIEECGGVVVCQEACSGIKSVATDTSTEGDPLEAIARRHFLLPCSCMTPNTGRTELLGELISDFKADAVVDLVWQACHTYNVEAHLVGEYVREKHNLPYLKLETDYSPSDREQLRVRIQTLLELTNSEVRNQMSDVRRTSR